MELFILVPHLASLIHLGILITVSLLYFPRFYTGDTRLDCETGLQLPRSFELLRHLLPPSLRLVCPLALCFLF